MDNATNDMLPLGFMIGFLSVLLLTAVAMWKIYSKAGEAGWKSLISIYNTFVFQRIVGRPAWWVLLMLVPVVNIVLAMIECADLARVFGKGVGYAVGLVLLGPFYVMAIGFGPATYVGPNLPQAPPTPMQPPVRYSRAA